jgi:hypothetical protein
VIGAQLAVPQPEPQRPPSLAGARQPVQLAVTGAEALLVSGASPEGSRVDVVVSQQGGLGQQGRTYVAAAGARLLALARPGGPGEGWSATLALTREEALDLIGAETAARQIRLLPRP